MHTMTTRSAMTLLVPLLLGLGLPRPIHAAAVELRSIAGVYPHLTMYNTEGECGTGAVVPWADRLWVVTYSPHRPTGSSDKLYEITPELRQIVRSESVGGTPANRMIHRESKQLNIGPYLIDAHRGVRVLSPKVMPGRLTGSARHLTDPENKIFVATMEEGLYSVDVHSLAVTEHIQDGNGQPAVGQGLRSRLPGYHGKGLYSGQGLLVYANNGEHGSKARSVPDIPSGALASWRGAGDWQLIRRNQFTEVTGPGGIHGNASAATDPIWSLGWDFRSLIVMLLDGGKWYAYRLPKGSHSYDGAHGWNTEWPRIRDIGEPDLLATMHGTFWRFPKAFTARNSAGIAPRSNYLKVVGDFSRWNNQLVLGCDDSAQKEFLNHRPFKSTKAAPVQSNSNLWFVDPHRLDELGPVIGRGSVWLHDDVKAGVASDPYLFAGYDYRTLAIRHATGRPVTFTLEVDRNGDGQWRDLQSFQVAESLIHVFPEAVRGVWVRVKTDADAKSVAVHFHYRNRDARSSDNDPIFAPLSAVDVSPRSQGMLRSHRRVLSLRTGDREYELDDKLKLRPAATSKGLFAGASQPRGGIAVDEASAIIKEDGRTYRIPKNDAYATDHGRICREVATERDLFNFHGTLYELPARNAQGFAKLRPIATHNLAIDDYASHFGLLFLTGLNDSSNRRVIRSSDGKAAIWAGVIDDLWRLGKPRGQGGPWKNTRVAAGIPSDPYLMTGFDEKSVQLVTDHEATISVEIDIDGTAVWVPYKKFELSAAAPLNYRFPRGLSAYWVRVTCDADCRATAWFTYE